VANAPGRAETTTLQLTTPEAVYQTGFGKSVIPVTSGGNVIKTARVQRWHQRVDAISFSQAHD
jgi:hypothetical protein